MCKVNKNIVAEFLKARGNVKAVAGVKGKGLALQGGKLWSYEALIGRFESGGDSDVVWLEYDAVYNSPSSTTARHVNLLKRIAKEKGFRLAMK